MKKVLRSFITASAVALITTPAFAADIVIGVPNWPSVRVTAHVLKVVLEDKLGFEVELQTSTNPIIFEAMDKGSMHVHPEVWLPNQQNLHDKYVVEKKSVKMNPNGVPAFTGICVTKHTADTLGIKKLSELTDPSVAEKFDTDGDGKGEIWIGASGWASTTTEKVRAKSYGFAETMNLLELDETLALARVDSAVAQKKPIVFMCYTPHHMFAMHDLVVLEEPPHDPAKWKIIQPTDDPDWLQKSSAGVAWSVPNLHIHYSAALEKSHQLAAQVLSKAKFDTDTISSMTFALVVEKQDPAEFAKKWVAENESEIETWLK